jgi:hypothetical protein
MNAGIFSRSSPHDPELQTTTRLATRTPTAIRTTTTIRRRARMLVLVLVLVLLSFDIVDIGRCVIPLSLKKPRLPATPVNAARSFWSTRRLLISTDGIYSNDCLTK